MQLDNTESLIYQLDKVKETLLHNKLENVSLSREENTLYEWISTDIERIKSNISDLALLYQQYHTHKNNKKLKQKLQQYYYRQYVLSQTTPLISLFGVCAYDNMLDTQPTLKCHDCHKQFTGTKYLSRFRQHYRDKHQNKNKSV